MFITLQHRGVSAVLIVTGILCLLGLLAYTTLSINIRN